MIPLIKNGEVDFYMDSVFPATLLSDATGAQPILRRWRNCDPDYFSVIFTKAGSGISSIDDLRGQMIAMDRPDSTSGFVLPAVFLIDHGLKLVVKKSFTDTVAGNEVGIYFSLADIDTLRLVLDGYVGAGATDDYNFLKLEEDFPGTLTRLAETGSMPRQVVLVRPDLSDDLKEAIKQELVKCDLSPVCVKAMKQNAATCKYDDTPDGIDFALNQMRQMHEKIKSIPGWLDTFQGIPQTPKAP